MIRSYQALINRILILFDGLTLAFAFSLAWYFKFRTEWFQSYESLPSEEYFILGMVIIPLFLCMNSMFGLYSSQRTRRVRRVFLQIVKSSLITLMVTMSILFFLKEVHVSREMLALFMVFSFLLLSLERVAMRMAMQQLRARGYNQKHMLIIGAGNLGIRVHKLMSDHREFGFHVFGFLDDRLYAGGQKVNNVPVLGQISDLEMILNQHMIDQVVLALPIDAYNKVGQIISVCEKMGVQALIIPDYFNYLPAKPRFEAVGGLPMIDVRHVPLDELMNAAMKRTFDIVFSIAALLILAPVFLLIAAAVKASSPGPVFFVQERVGKNRRLFRMYKFRSMRVSVEETSNTKWTTPEDSRKTRVGALLRKTSLDELPQFFNVLKGDMSIIGPRPERPYFVEQFKEDIPKYMIKHRVRPGITGWAQINGWRGDTSIEERIKCDIDYIENWTFSLDLKIVVKTILHGFINKNAY